MHAGLSSFLILVSVVVIVISFALYFSPPSQSPVVDYNGLVSIIIPSFNRYEMLTHAIRSCLNQTYKNIQVIVIDDCSTDPRYRQLQTLFPTITVLHLPVNMRVKHQTTAAQGMTRNEGIKVAKGQWLAFLDDDDFYVPTKLETQLKRLKSNKMLMSCSNMTTVTHGNTTTDKLDIQPVRLYFPPKTVKQTLTAKDISDTNWINLSTSLVHKSIVEKVGMFILGTAEDYHYWKRAVQYCNVLYVDEPLVLYTVNNQKHYS